MQNFSRHAQRPFRQGIWYTVFHETQGNFSRGRNSFGVRRRRRNRGPAIVPLAERRVAAERLADARPRERPVADGHPSRDGRRSREGTRMLRAGPLRRRPATRPLLREQPVRCAEVRGAPVALLAEVHARRGAARREGGAGVRRARHALRRVRERTQGGRCGGHVHPARVRRDEVPSSNRSSARSRRSATRARPRSWRRSASPRT